MRRPSVKGRALVCGAGGFLGSHLVHRLKRDGYWVRGADLRRPQFSISEADEFLVADLRDKEACREACDGEFDRVYQLAAEMGGAGYIFTGENDADIVANSAMINLQVLAACAELAVPRILFSSSACVYPRHNQIDPENFTCAEDTVYPADPDSEYGWEKLFAERLYLTFQRNRRIEVRIARLHNVYGPGNQFSGGREKAPAAMCRKVAEARDGDEIEIWGDGRQTRSFLFVDDCIEGIVRLMNSEFCGPFNIGSEETVTIAELAETVARIAGKRLRLRSIRGPEGVRGRSSSNALIEKHLGWRPATSLIDGLRHTYAWVNQQVAQPDGRNRRPNRGLTAGVAGG